MNAFAEKFASLRADNLQRGASDAVDSIVTVVTHCDASSSSEAVPISPVSVESPSRRWMDALRNSVRASQQVARADLDAKNNVVAMASDADGFQLVSLEDLYTSVDWTGCNDSALHDPDDLDSLEALYSSVRWIGCNCSACDHHDGASLGSQSSDWLQVASPLHIVGNFSTTAAARPRPMQLDMESLREHVDFVWRPSPYIVRTHDEIVFEEAKHIFQAEQWPGPLHSVGNFSTTATARPRPMQLDMESLREHLEFVWRPSPNIVRTLDEMVFEEGKRIFQAHRSSSLLDAPKARAADDAEKQTSRRFFTQGVPNDANTVCQTCGMVIDPLCSAMYDRQCIGCYSMQHGIYWVSKA